MRVLITSYPKSGTNLIIQMFTGAEHIKISGDMMYLGTPIVTDADQAHNDLKLREMAAQIAGFPGVAFGHIPHNYTFEEAMNTRPTLLVVNIRDPRDVIVSHHKYIIRKPGAAMNFLLDGKRRLSECDDPMLELIKLSPVLWEKFLPWLKIGHVVRYEDLREDARKEARRVVDILGIDEAVRLRIGSEDAMIRKISPAKSPTFRKGGIGDWKSFFEPHHIEEYRKRMKKTAKALGYGY